VTGTSEKKKFWARKVLFQRHVNKEIDSKQLNECWFTCVVVKIRFMLVFSEFFPEVSTQILKHSPSALHYKTHEDLLGRTVVAMRHLFSPSRANDFFTLICT
jgi:hypothetical protein